MCDSADGGHRINIGGSTIEIHSWYLATWQRYCCTPCDAKQDLFVTIFFNFFTNSYAEVLFYAVLFEVS
jgi:hypothetical protein